MVTFKSNNKLLLFHKLGDNCSDNKQKKLTGKIDFPLLALYCETVYST